MNFLRKNNSLIICYYKRIRIFFLFAFLICTGRTFAQDNNVYSSDSLKKTVVRINLLNPGISVEQGISLTNSIVAEIGLFVKHIYDTLQYKHYFFFYPRVKGEYRHYYNFSKRLREGKNINRFSGSYIGIVYQHLFGDKREPTFDQAGVMWGTQYVSEKKFHLGFNIGFGYAIYADPRLAPEFTLLGDLKLGYTF